MNHRGFPSAVITIGDLQRPDKLQRPGQAAVRLRSSRRQRLVG
jgi:hypothetical protein